MKFANLFNGPLHNLLDDKAKEEVEEEFIYWLKSAGKFFLMGLILGLMIGVSI